VKADASDSGSHRRSAPAAQVVDAVEVARAVEVLSAGGLIGLPTETVYGLAADASSAAAVARIFAAKGRPADHPVIVHLAMADEMRAWARDIPDAAWQLAKAFWPGPMTLILKRAAHVLDAVTGGQDTVGLRVPSHPAAHAVLAAFALTRPGRPAGIAAPSANQFGHVSPTTAQHVRDEFGESVDLVLDGGQCEVGIESTIIDLTGDAPRILRPGVITDDAVKAALGAPLKGSAGGRVKPDGPAPRVSGALDSHYSPRTRLLVVPSDTLAATLSDHAGKRIAVLSFSTARAPKTLHWLASRQPRIYAHNLYAHLRAMDVAGCELLIVEAPPEGSEWDGINDRLKRAAFDSRAN
jgi:L-threonylcarbamoyladenylate synthase